MSSQPKMNYRTLLSTVRWIKRNTQFTREHLTPEIGLHLITPHCPLWLARPDNCPLDDPYWAFYWPGGQGLAKYLLAQPELLRDRRILDIGSGGGANVCAAVAHRCRSVYANDIDQNALIATALNLRANGLATNRVEFTAEDLITNTDPAQIAQASDTILVGDLLYDSTFAARLSAWLTAVKTSAPSTRILMGDPGRHGLQHAAMRLRSLATVALPEYITNEHYGFTSVTIYEVDT